MTPRTLSVIALASILALVASVAGMRMRVRWREAGAAEALETIVSAERAFRDAGGRGGYATSIESLTQPCPDGGTIGFRAGDLAAAGYRITIRARTNQPAASRPEARALRPERSEPRSIEAADRLDCHGRPTARDFIASAEPVRSGIDGLRALSATASGRLFVFFDGVAPREADLASGLAMPLDDLRPIP